MQKRHWEFKSSAHRLTLLMIRFLPLTVNQSTENYTFSKRQSQRPKNFPENTRKYSKSPCNISNSKSTKSQPYTRLVFVSRETCIYVAFSRLAFLRRALLRQCTLVLRFSAPSASTTRRFSYIPPWQALLCHAFLCFIVCVSVCFT